MADQTGPVIDGEPSIRAPGSLLHRIARCPGAAAVLVEEGVIGCGAEPVETRGLPLRQPLRRNRLECLDLCEGARRAEVLDLA